MRRGKLLGGVGVALVGGVLGFIAVAVLGGEDPAPQLPTFDQALPVAVALPVTGDPWEAATAAIAAEVAGRDAASAAAVEVPLSPSTLEPISGDGADDSDPAGDAADVPDPDDLPDPPAAAGDPPADGRAVDVCVSESPPADCPPGVAGTILAIHDLPDFAVVVKPEPFAPGSAPHNYLPECSPSEAVLGAIDIGVAVNRPADIVLRYYPYTGLVPGEDVTAVDGPTMATPPAAEAAWVAWGESHGSYDDPRYWIDHCTTLAGLTPGDYTLEVAVTDRLSGATTNKIEGFSIGDTVGTAPRLRRRPTSLFPFGVDILVVSATRTPEQQVVVVAEEWTAESTCDLGGDIATLTPGAVAGRVDGRQVGESQIHPDTLADPTYPYFLEHSISTTHLLALEEGNHYLVCLYWLESGGPAFAPDSLVESEQVAVSTPDAYRPKVFLAGFQEMLGGLESITVAVAGPECIEQVTPPVGSFGSPSPDHFAYGPPRLLCAPDTGLSSIDVSGGFRMSIDIVQAGGARIEGGAAVILPHGIRCAVSPCPPQPDHVALVPLPAIPTTGRLCGSGWGACDPSAPSRSAGFMVLAVEFAPGDSSGVVDWSIGDLTPAPTTPAALGPTALLSVRSEAFSLGSSAGLRVIVEADRPVILQAEVQSATEDGPSCFVDPPGRYESTDLAVRHEFTVNGLCHGEEYVVAFSGGDAAGNPVAVFHGPAVPPSPTAEVFVPTLRASMEGTIAFPDPAVLDPGGTGPYTAVVSIASVATPRLGDRGIGGGGTLRAHPSGIDIAELDVLGWTYLHGGLCSTADPVGFELDQQGLAVLNQVDLVVSVRIELYRNLPLGGVVLSNCVRGAPVASYLLTQTVDLPTLLAGVTLTSDDGAVSYRLRVLATDFISS